MHLVSDFDGVWTDPLPEANAIRDLMIERLAHAGQTSQAQVVSAFQALAEAFKHSPYQYGWIFENEITAFAGEDMYGRNHAFAVAIWEKVPVIAESDMLNAALRKIASSAEEFANECFKDGRAQYRESNMTFLVPEAAQVVAQLREDGHKVTIVSNSRIEHIVDLFEAANIDRGGIDIVGGARKFHLGKVEALEKQWHWNSAPISLHRPHYYELLGQLKPDAIIGDVLSLDLALPLYLRHTVSGWEHFRGGLIVQPYTPEWILSDKAIMEARGLDTLKGLAAVPEWLNSLVKKS